MGSYGKICDDSYSEETSTTDSAGSDWEEEYKRRTKKLWKPTQDFAQEAGGNWRNFKSETYKGKGGGGRRGGNSIGLGKCESSVESKPRQCYWVHCVKAARRDSKYCSDECGVKLAELRILTILPERLKEWQATPSVAEAKNMKDLADIKTKIMEYQKQFDELEEARQDLDEYIDAVSKIPYDPIHGVSEAAVVDEGVASCVICGHETNAKSYMRHIERCFTRIEKNVVIESTERLSLPGTRLFCDTLNKEKGTYCLRLAVNCPDHSKKTQFVKNGICGAPLSAIGELKLDNICMAPRSACQRHYNWEKIRRAEIDIRKVDVWTKQKDMRKKEEALVRQMSNRGGLMDLLLNSTKTENSTNESTK